MDKLQGKVAFVSGASRGIGSAIARRLATDGAEVGVHYGKSRESAAGLVAEIEAAGGKAFLVQGDLSDQKSADAVAAAFLGQLKERGREGFDILVNNAGVAEYASLQETTEEVFEKLFNVNVKAPFFLTRALVPHLNRDGRILNLSSIVSQQAFDGIPAYAMTKGAIDTFTVQLAKQLGPQGITVNSVAPGATMTEMSPWLAEEQGARMAFDNQALKRVGLAEDIAALVGALAGPDGAWITGQRISASGGWGL